MAPLLLVCGLANATAIYTNPITITAADPTQTNRLSRNGIPQDWAGGEPFPGEIAGAGLHYHIVDLDLAALESGYTTYGEFIQISFDSTSATTFLSAYLGSYNPASKSTNWLGDAGTSGDAFGTDTVFFQVIVPTPQHLILVLNETAANAGLNFTPTNVLVEAFTDTQYTDLVPRPAVPEPGTLELLAGAVALMAARRFRRGRAVA